MKIFRHEFLEFPPCVLDDSKGYHVYTTPEGQQLRSVTTMLGQTRTQEQKQKLIDWREQQGEQLADYIMKTSALVGTQAHALNENYLHSIKEKDKYFLLSHAHHQNFIPKLDEISKIYGIEIALYSNEMGLAGTADLIAEHKGKMCIIDYKTKRTKQRREWITDYFIQGTAYAAMCEELTGTKIEQILIWISSEQNTLQEFAAKPEDYQNALEQRLSLFQ